MWWERVVGRQRGRRAGVLCHAGRLTGLTGTDQSGRADRVRAEPARDPVHRSLGVAPRRWRLLKGQLGGCRRGRDKPRGPHPDQAQPGP